MKGEMLSKMLVIAVNAHQGQYDKAGAPYILHPL
jgi:(p)ppGpp synthase/HD superfamily hydrolase